MGRTLKDCGEDLLVEISEILFNELAFFRLMQELDSGSNAKHKSKKTNELMDKENQSPKVQSLQFFFSFDFDRYLARRLVGVF